MLFVLDAPRPCHVVTGECPTQGLLRGISTRSKLTEHNWATRLGDRLRVFWQASGVSGRPPFAPARGQEALEYARLPTMQRRAPQPCRASPSEAVMRHPAWPRGSCFCRCDRLSLLKFFLHHCCVGWPMRRCKLVACHPAMFKKKGYYV